MEVQYEARITGRVQGVGYRYFVKQIAGENSVSGWVKNLSDGSVLVMARGEEAVMETFLDHLKEGPSMAAVENVSVSKMPGLENFNGFRVKY